MKKLLVSLGLIVLLTGFAQAETNGGSLDTYTQLTTTGVVNRAIFDQETLEVNFIFENNPFVDYQQSQVTYQEDSIVYIRLLWAEKMWNGAARVPMGLIRIQAADVDISGQVYSYIKSKVNEYHGNWTSDPAILFSIYDNALGLHPR